MTVLMRHPDSGGEFDAQPSQVPHLQEAGWQVVAGQEEQGEQWPAELRRFEGQEQVKIRHPETGGETVVAASAVPFHRERGWQVLEPGGAPGVDEQAEQAEAEDLEDLTVAQLQDKARAAGVAVSGTKAELVARLREQPADHAAGDQPAQPSEEE